MIARELRSQVDAIWNARWSGGISNPMEVMEQITCLLFIRRLDDTHTRETGKTLALERPIWAATAIGSTYWRYVLV